MARKHTERSKRNSIKVNPYLINAVAPSRLEFYEPYGVTDDVYFKMMYASNYPDQLDLGWGDDLIGLKALKAPVSIACYPTATTELTASINRTISESQFQLGEGMKSYTDLKKKRIEAERAEEATDLLLRENTKMFNVCVYVMLRSDEKDGLIPAKSYLESVQTNVTVKHVLSNTENAFFAASPFFMDDPFGMEAFAVPMPAITIAWMRALIAAGIDDQEGVLIGTDGRGGIIRLDPETHTDERSNSNFLIVGETGAGKSALGKHITAYEHLLYDTRVIVFNDPESEWGVLARRAGGDVARIGEDCNISPFEPRCIGSMDAADDDNTDEELQEAIERARGEYVLASTIPFLKTFLEMAFAGITPELMDHLAIALELLYADYGITTDTTFAEYNDKHLSYPVMRDLYDKLTELSKLGGEYAQFNDQFTRLALAVRSAAVGHDKHMWNTRTDFSSKSGFTVIDTQGMSDDERLKRAQYFNLISWAWSEVRAGRFSGKYIRLVADEIHTLMNKDCIDAAALVANIARRIRKYNGGLMAMTPMIADLLDESIAVYGRAVAYNSAYRFFGKSSGVEEGGNLNVIQKLLNIEDEVRDELGTAPKKRFIAAVGTEELSWVTVDAIKDWELDMFGHAGGK